MKHILWTRPSGLVSVTVPSANYLRHMQAGGRWRGERRGFVEEQIERNIADGVSPDVAQRFCRALAFGGCSEADALALIRDRDCRHGSAHELIDPDELPDRWFRDAWRRSHNGGPIWLDVEACKPIQWQRVRSIAEAEAQKLTPRSIDLERLRHAIIVAESPDEIRIVMPWTV